MLICIVLLARQVFPKQESHATQLRAAAEEIEKRGKDKKEVRQDILNRAKNYHAIIAGELKRKGRWAYIYSCII